MTAGVQLHGFLGLAVMTVAVCGALGTLALARLAQRRGTESRLAPWSMVSLAAAMMCNGIPHIWPSLNVLLWAVFPLQAASIAVAAWVLYRHRQVRVVSSTDR